MTEADLPWLHYLCIKRYSDRFDEQSTDGWFRNIVLKTPLLFYPARTDNAFAISLMSVVPWLPNEFEVNVVLLCADEGYMWDALRLLRDSIAWAKRRKCTYWRFCSDTEYDFAPIARRLGAEEIAPRFMMRL